jgi:ubiquinone/menaquinone biosynthesis C-methylase UbiE
MCDRPGMRSWYEEVWEQLPGDLTPEAAARRRDFLLSWVSPGDRVLDLGCGDGTFTAALSESGTHPTGADVAEAALRRARERHPGADYARIEPHGPWPFPDAGFDAVWAGEVIEHVADTESWVNEVRRVLRPGGRLLVTTPRVGPLARARRAPDPRGQHLRFYTRRTLRDLLTDMGFTDVHVAARHGLLLGRAVR